MATLSAYELTRIATIESNEKRLKEILGDASEQCRKERRTLTAEELEQRQLTKQRRRQELEANQRSSSRLVQKQARDAELALAAPAVPSIYESERALDAVEAELPKRKRAQRKRQSREESGAALTEEQRQTLASAEGWLSAMREYFREKLSDPNLRNVMKVAERLASGAGSRCHTKHDGVFCEGRPITMATDFEALRREANAWLHPDDDPGHGWRLDHPIGKCMLFQRHLYEQRQLSARAKKLLAVSTTAAPSSSTTDEDEQGNDAPASPAPASPAPVTPLLPPKASFFGTKPSPRAPRAARVAPVSPPTAAPPVPPTPAATVAPAAAATPAAPLSDGTLRSWRKRKAGGPVEGRATRVANKIAKAAPLALGVGAQLDVPADIFGIDDKALRYAGLVTKLNKNDTCTVHFASDSTTFWFPTSAAKEWLV